MISKCLWRFYCITKYLIYKLIMYFFLVTTSLRYKISHDTQMEFFTDSLNVLGIWQVALLTNSSSSQCIHIHWCRSVADPVFPAGGHQLRSRVRQTIILANFCKKTAWQWHNLEQEDAGVPRALLGAVGWPYKAHSHRGKAKAKTFFYICH